MWNHELRQALAVSSGMPIYLDAMIAGSSGRITSSPDSPTGSSLSSSSTTATLYRSSTLPAPLLSKRGSATPPASVEPYPVPRANLT